MLTNNGIKSKIQPYRQKSERRKLHSLESSPINLYNPDEKTPPYQSKPERSKLNSLESSPISLKRPEIKLPKLSTNSSPLKNINLKSNLSSNSPSISLNRRSPSPTSLPPKATIKGERSLNLIRTKKSPKSNLTSKKNYKSSVPAMKSPTIKRGRLKLAQLIIEKLKKVTSNIIQTPSSDISSADSKRENKEETKGEESKRFESPAVWQFERNSMVSYISESSYLKQPSSNQAYSKEISIKDAEETYTTHDIARYNELKFKFIADDPITEGPNGRIRQWKSGEILGIGSYAQVFKAFDINTGEFFAVKRIFFNPNNKTQSKYIADLEAEVKILNGLSNKHIVKYLGSEMIQEFFCIYLEYLPGGSLSKLLYNLGALSEITVRVYLIQILKGLEYLHYKGVIHRDIKGANIMLDSKGKLKLSDFGCSKQYVSSDVESGFVTSLKGSLPWMAPEVIKQKGYGRKADIWSVGCVALEMLTAKKPWEAYDNHVAFMMKVATEDILPEIPLGISEAARNFLMSCLQRDPSKRKSAKELLQHDFLKVLGN